MALHNHNHSHFLQISLMVGIKCSPGAYKYAIFKAESVCHWEEKVYRTYYTVFFHPLLILEGL